MDNVHGIRIIFFPFGHFLTIRSQHQAIDNQIFERSLSKQMSCNNQKSIKPTTSLIYTFSNKISWKTLIELFCNKNIEWYNKLSLLIKNRISNVIKLHYAHFRMGNEVVRKALIQIQTNSQILLEFFSKEADQDVWTE